VKLHTLALLPALVMTAALTTGALAQTCPSACQVTGNGKSGPDTSTVVIAFGPGFSDQNIQAFINGIEMWNNAFLRTWTDLYFTTSSYGPAHIWIEVDPWLADGAVNDTDSNGYGTIWIAANLRSQGIDFLAHVLAHELGHSLGFENNWGMTNSSTTCAGNTIMYGGVSPGGPLLQSIPVCDRTAVSNNFPTTMPENPPGGGQWYYECVSPIVLDLGNDGYRMSSVADGVLFDLRNEGVARRVAWTRGGTANAFLAMDRNGNGTIDNGGELFGNRTRLRNGLLAGNGFEVLGELDDNGDGVVDARDRVWSDLLLWIDADHNGISSAGELQPIATSAVAAIETAYRFVGRKDRWGNYFPYMNFFWVRLGASQVRRVDYDVFLSVSD
jgi:hypothetical protein